MSEGIPVETVDQDGNDTGTRRWLGTQEHLDQVSANGQPIGHDIERGKSIFRR